MIVNKWTMEKIKEGFLMFFKEHGRYPTAVEIDGYDKLPSSRQIQRVHGGLPTLRKKLGIGGQDDFTKGDYSSRRATMINNRAHKLEKEVYDYLVDLFGKPFVHREYFFTDDKRNRTDFFVYYDSGNFSVDVFYPKDLKCLSGCLNSKLKTYQGNNITIKYPVIFLMMNKEIGERVIEEVLERKSNKLSPYQKVMSFDQFKVFCSSKRRLKT